MLSMYSLCYKLIYCIGLDILRLLVLKSTGSRCLLSDELSSEQFLQAMEDFLWYTSYCNCTHMHARTDTHTHTMHTYTHMRTCVHTHIQTYINKHKVDNRSTATYLISDNTYHACNYQLAYLPGVAMYVDSLHRLHLK